MGRGVRATEVEIGGGGDEQYKHKGGKGRVEKEEGIRTKAEERRVGGGSKSNKSRKEEEMSSISIREKEEE